GLRSRQIPKPKSQSPKPKRGTSSCCLLQSRKVRFHFFGLRRIGLQFEVPPVRRGGILRSLRGFERKPVGQLEIRLARRQLDRLFIGGKGGADVARRVQCLREVVVGRVIVREQPRRRAVPFNGRPPFLQLRVCPRAVELICPRIGFQRYGLIE